MIYFCIINSIKIFTEIEYNLLLCGFGFKVVVHILPILFMLHVHRKTMFNDLKQTSAHTSENSEFSMHQRHPGSGVKSQYTRSSLNEEA